MKNKKFLNLLDKTIPMYIGMFMLKSLQDKDLAWSNLIAPEVLAPTLAYSALIFLSQPIFSYFERHGAKDLYGYLRNKKAQSKQTIDKPKM